MQIGMVTSVISIPGQISFEEPQISLVELIHNPLNMKYDSSSRKNEKLNETITKTIIVDFVRSEK
jgi:hypothetical protein